MNREWTEVPPTASVREFASRYAPAAKAKTLPVAEAGRYLGMISLDALFDVPSERWSVLTVLDLMQGDEAVPGPDWPLNRAASWGSTVSRSSEAIGSWG